MSKTELLAQLAELQAAIEACDDVDKLAYVDKQVKSARKRLAETEDAKAKRLRHNKASKECEERKFQAKEAAVIAAQAISDYATLVPASSKHDRFNFVIDDILPIFAVIDKGTPEERAETKRYAREQLSQRGYI